MYAYREMLTLTDPQVLRLKTAIHPFLRCNICLPVNFPVMLYAFETNLKFDESFAAS